MPGLPDFFQEFFSRLNIHVWAGVAAVLAGAAIMVRICGAAVDRLFSSRKGPALLDSRRARTMAAILKSVLRYAVYIIAGLTILGLLGVHTGALLAGAGLLGLAVGFGARNLIQDVITGFFIIFEDQFAVGEYISAAGVSGIVEDMGLRVTRLKDPGGQVHFIPNGKISQVTNFSRDSLQVAVDVGIAYDEDLPRAVEVLEQAVRELARDWAGLITAGPDVLGLVNLFPGGMTVRISASARPLQHWKVERELRRRAKEALDRAGIRPPAASPP